MQTSYSKHERRAYKLFECTICNKKFGQKPSLNKHIALQHSMMVKRHLVVKYVKISLHVKNI